MKLNKHVAFNFLEKEGKELWKLPKLTSTDRGVPEGREGKTSLLNNVECNDNSTKAYVKSIGEEK